MRARAGRILRFLVGSEPVDGGGGARGDVVEMAAGVQREGGADALLQPVPGGGAGRVFDRRHARMAAIFFAVAEREVRACWRGLQRASGGEVRPAVKPERAGNAGDALERAVVVGTPGGEQSGERVSGDAAPARLQAEALFDSGQPRGETGKGFSRAAAEIRRFFEGTRRGPRAEGVFPVGAIQREEMNAGGEQVGDGIGFVRLEAGEDERRGGGQRGGGVVAEAFGGEDTGGGHGMSCGGEAYRVTVEVVPL